MSGEQTSPKNTTINNFIALNRRMARALERHLPAAFTRHLHTVYKYDVATAVNQRLGQTILDIGGGRECPFLPFVKNPAAYLIVAVDYSDGQLRFNYDLNQKVVADAASPAFPFREGSVDLIVSRSVVEHLYDNTAFFANCARVLRPGGTMIHTFPCKLAPFSLLNRMLPNRVTKRLIAYFYPEWADECGFVAYYDFCQFRQIRDILCKNGFIIHKFEFRYYQSIYFDFFFPLYILMLLYDLTTWFFSIKGLACAILVEGSKPLPEHGAVARSCSVECLSA